MPGSSMPSLNGTKDRSLFSDASVRVQSVATMTATTVHNCVPHRDGALEGRLNVTRCEEVPRYAPQACTEINASELEINNNRTRV